MEDSNRSRQSPKPWPICDFKHKLNIQSETLLNRPYIQVITIRKWNCSHNGPNWLSKSLFQATISKDIMILQNLEIVTLTIHFASSPTPSTPPAHKLSLASFIHLPLSNNYGTTTLNKYVYSPSSITNHLLDNKKCYMFRPLLRDMIRQQNTIHKTIGKYAAKFLSFGFIYCILSPDDGL